ncbi:MAG TPA: phosphate ABC transporter substrate-binding protein [Candidatus Ornithospirochaeta stercorigallinarum]|nr:phosphate ABC transporter substrate-binding protein [Candidatus Ornithospirochaeta stercorigallinarum]
MKKFLVTLLVALCAFSAFAQGANEKAQSVSTDGSTSMESVVLSLAEVFEEDTGIVVTYNPTGSGSGITAAAEGRADIGLSSRALKDEEVASGLTGTTVALDGIAIIVNTENPVGDLSVADIAALYKGEITNWAEVGGNDAPVVLIGREAGSGTRDGFESITDTEDACLYNQELTSTGAVITAVVSNPNAIGYASLSAVDETVKTVLVDGVAPSEETVLSGEYQIQRPFVFVTKTDTPLSEAAQQFFDFALSTDASDVIADAGAVPLV